VIARAREILIGLERDELSRGGRPTLSGESGGPPSAQPGLFSVSLDRRTGLRDDEVRARLASIDIDRTTPLEALKTLQELKALADDE
jgi:hypothetical protein